MKIWMVAAVALLCSCGIFKKTSSRFSLTDREEAVWCIDSAAVRIDTSVTTTEESLELLFRLPPGGLSVLPDSAGLAGIIDRLAVRGGEVRVKARRRVMQENKIVESAAIHSAGAVKKDVKRVAVEKKKDSNTTVAANFPWYWWVVMAVVLGLIFVVLRKMSVF